MLVLVLAGMMLLQLLLPVSVALPVDGSVARIPAPRTPPNPALVQISPLLAARTLFAPDAASGAGTSGATDPLEGAIIGGVLRERGLTVALVQMPGGAIRKLYPGGEIAGWRLLALDADAAQLVHNGQRLTVPYGAHAAASAQNSSEPSQ